MLGNRLSDLQSRILVLLSALEAPWTLVGGAALAGFHLGHRTTRDLDLFFRPRNGLGDLSAETRAILERTGLTVTELRNTRNFVRFSVASGEEMIIVDLVSEPAEPPCPPMAVSIGDVTVKIASPLELLASKLCTLLSRAEIRDLVDVRALVERGEDLVQGLTMAPLIDAGFSPVTLAWVLRDLDVLKLALATGVEQHEAQQLADFKEALIRKVVDAARPA